MVLRIRRQKLADSKKRMKWRRPTQSLPMIPRCGLKFLKAMVTPYMGTYWNRKTSATVGSSSR